MTEVITKIKKAGAILKLDAAGQAPGRLATKVVGILLGKSSAGYQRHLPAQGQMIEIANIEQLKFTGRKLTDKIYYHHTGYIGHLKEVKMKVVFEKDPGMLFKKIVRGMLPKNKWRDKLLKQISFK